MRITQETNETGTLIKIGGRIDAYRATQLREILEEVSSSGADRLRLDLSEVDFLSSAGVRVLLESYRQIKALRGAFGVVNPSSATLSALELNGSRSLLVMTDTPAARPAAALDRLMERIETPRKEQERTSRTAQIGSAQCALYAPNASTPLRARLAGDPAKLFSGGYAEKDCQKISFGPNLYGIGVGAMGAGYSDASERFGEFLGAAGAAVYLPTDGQRIPDYLCATRAGSSEVFACYAALFEGVPNALIRFDSDAENPASLDDLVEATFVATSAKRVGFVGVVETKGLVGASLRRSPVSGASASLTIPEARGWLAFTAEPAWERHVALLVGIVARDSGGSLAPALKPLYATGGVNAHIHAAAFSYHPLPKGVIELKPTLNNLFENHDLLDVLHLLKDDRPIGGAGACLFSRGALWAGALEEAQETNSL